MWLRRVTLNTWKVASLLKVTHLHSLYFPKSQISARLHGGHTLVWKNQHNTVGKSAHTTQNTPVPICKCSNSARGLAAAEVDSDTIAPRLTNLSAHLKLMPRAIALATLRVCLWGCSNRVNITAHLNHRSPQLCDCVTLSLEYLKKVINYRTWRETFLTYA